MIQKLYRPSDLTEYESKIQRGLKTAFNKLYNKYTVPKIMAMIEEDDFNPFMTSYKQELEKYLDKVNLLSTSVAYSSSLESLKLTPSEGFESTLTSTLLVIKESLLDRMVSIQTRLINFIRSQIGSTIDTIKDAAKFIRASIGLGPNDFRNYNSYVSVISTTRHLTAAQKLARIETYREQLLSNRSNLVSTIHTTYTSSVGVDLAMQDAQVQGHKGFKQVWVTRGDHRVRGSHRTMNGQTAEMNEMFVTGRGYFLRYPGDPLGPASEIANCRCRIELRSVGE